MARRKKERKMVRNDMNLEVFEKELAKETKVWVMRDAGAKVLYDRIISLTERAQSWYRGAENNGNITRWVPDDNSGEHYIIYSAETDAAAALELRFALEEYAMKKGKELISKDIERAALVAYGEE